MVYEAKTCKEIQVTTSELHGKYDKAFCLVIPFSELSEQVSELTKIRNIPISIRCSVR
jgi:hypothetical protein